MKKYTILSAIVLVVFACKKKTNETTPETVVSNEEILSQMALNINNATYSDLDNKAINLHNSLVVFSSNPTEANLEICKTNWKNTRSTWEKSEGFLYGPVSTDNVDPRIDTWPVDFNAINTLLQSSTDFSVASNITNLDDALKGFHPIEFILWGQNGNKTASEITSREKEYLVALSLDLKNLVYGLATEWNTTASSSFYTKFKTPNTSNPFYTTYKSVYEEMVNAMIGICDEVANGKMNDPLIAQDPSLEESPYSKNSMIDFTNNVLSVENVYLGKFTNDGYGMEDFVRKYNLSLDNSIKNKIAVAKNAMNSITVPFGDALTQQPTQVQNAINALLDLQEVLEIELLPLIQQKITN